MGCFKNKIIIITGGGAGIGKALCLELSSRGAVVIVADINEKNAHQVAKEISAVVGLSQTLHYEGADLGVKVTTVCPGLVETDIYKKMEVANIPNDRIVQRFMWNDLFS